MSIWTTGETPVASRLRGRHGAALLGALGAAAVIAAAVLAGSGNGAGPAAAAATALGVDVDTSGNTAGSLGEVQGCTEVNVGDQFPVDIFARDVEGLEAWELRFAFDQRIVEMVDHRYDMFLLSTAPKAAIFPSLFDQETAGRYFLAAAELGGTPDSGSGVLARITLRAIAPGRSPAHVVVDPAYMGPYLTTTVGAGLFSGSVAEAEVAVGEPCESVSPTWAPTQQTPGPEPSATPTPSGDAGTGAGGTGPADSGGPGVGDPGGSGSATVPVSVEPGNPSPPDPTGTGGQVDDRASPTPARAVLQASGQAPAGDAASAESGGNVGDASGFPWWWILGGILGSVVVAGAGAVALAFKTRP